MEEARVAQRKVEAGLDALQARLGQEVEIPEQASPNQGLVEALCQDIVVACMALLSECSPSQFDLG